MSEQPIVPGTEVFGPVIKVKILRVTNGIGGIEFIEATAAHLDYPYDNRYTRRFTPTEWKEFLGCNQGGKG